IANTMICSENIATNTLLSVTGQGDAYAGAEAVTTFLTQLGLPYTFLTAPYEIPGVTPTPPTIPIRYPQTAADQRKAAPNVTNQMTVDEMGYLLASMYQCGFEDSGALLTRFPAGAYTPQECRKMLHVMANNNVDALLKAGVPEGITVAHKHGWVADTHANGGVFFTPGGDYVLVMLLHKPIWLEFEGESLPVFAEVSRTVYNWYNPGAPLAAIRAGLIPEANTCQYRDSPLTQDLTDPLWGQTAPAVRGDIIKVGVAP
ncbi:MAG: serine hydrolase, partial [Armatimonadetes bacterium]|nr:serine hydrolase [Anaerolineae bacterium]